MTSRSVIKNDNDIGLAMWARLYGRQLFFCAMLLSGIAVGAFLYAWLISNGLNGIAKIVLLFTEKRSEQTMAQTFISAATPNFIAWGILFICGFCAVSAPITSLVMMARGFGYGLMACALITGYQGNAISYICIYLLPNLIISGAALIFCCCEAADMSSYFWQAMSPSIRLRSNTNTAGIFCGKMLLYAVFIAAGAAAEAYAYSLF